MASIAPAEIEKGQLKLEIVSIFESQVTLKILNEMDYVLQGIQQWIDASYFGVAINNQETPFVLKKLDVP